MSKKIDASLDPLKIEGKSFIVGLQFAKDVGIYDLILEGNSPVMYRALVNITISPASVATIVYGIKAASQEFHNVSFSHVHRQENIPAHLLAKHIVGIANFSVWIEENHCFLTQALHHDVISSFF